MNLPKTKIKFIDKAIYIEDINALVISDIHIGYEESLNKQGVFIPRFQFKEMVEDLENIFSKVKEIRKIIILGDLKHEFGTISRQEWNETLKFLDILQEKADEIILIKGNHDTILGPLASRKNLSLKDNYIEKEYFFIHGDKSSEEIFKDSRIKYIFIGHVHPAIILKDKIKSEKYKCFLVGKVKGKKIIILPSFIPLTEGTDTYNPSQKIFAGLSTENFDVYAIGDEVYSLGKRKEI
jgi:hypothetical protein